LQAQKQFVPVLLKLLKLAGHGSKLLYARLVPLLACIPPLIVDGLTGGAPGFYHDLFQALWTGTLISS
jgi:hypothetical protein